MKVSFLVTYYNQAPFVAQSMESILALEKPCAWEILVGDDGSTDSTVEEVRRYQARYPDHIQLFVMPRKPNEPSHPILRVSENRRNLLEHASGDLLLVLDGDDRYCSTDFLVRAMEEFRKRQEVVAVAFGMRRECAKGGEELCAPRFKTKAEYLWPYVYLPAGAFVFRNLFSSENREALRQKGMIYDDEMITRYLLGQGEVVFTGEASYVYRYNPASIIQSGRELENRLFFALEIVLIRAIAPSFRHVVSVRQFPSVRFVWQRRGRLREILGEAQWRWFAEEVCVREPFLVKCLKWETLSRREKFCAFWAYHGKRVKKDILRGLLRLGRF